MVSNLVMCAMYSLFWGYLYYIEFKDLEDKIYKRILNTLGVIVAVGMVGTFIRFFAGKNVNVHRVADPAPWLIDYICFTLMSLFFLWRIRQWYQTTDGYFLRSMRRISREAVYMCGNAAHTQHVRTLLQFLDQKLPEWLEQLRAIDAAIDRGKEQEQTEEVQKRIEKLVVTLDLLDERIDAAEACLRKLPQELAKQKWLLHTAGLLEDSGEQVSVETLLAGVAKEYELLQQAQQEVAQIDSSPSVFITRVFNRRGEQ